MRNSIWCLPSQVLTGSPVCQTRAKFPRSSPSRASFSSPVCTCRGSVCVRASDPREEEPAETAPIFAHISLFAPPHLATLPVSPQRGGYLTSSSIRGHFRTRRHVRSSASFFFFIFLVWSHLLIRRSFLIPFSRIRQYPYNMGHRTPRHLVAALPEFSGDAVESNTLVSEYNASHVISRGTLHNALHRESSFRRYDVLHLRDTFNPANSDM